MRALESQEGLKLDNILWDVAHQLGNYPRISRRVETTNAETLTFRFLACRC